MRSEQTHLSETMFSALVAKFTNAFLEVRWSWPRKFSALNPYAFLLSDPKASELDTAELGRLSAELHAHLFGVTEDESAKVTVLLFEGDDAAMAKFAELDDTEIARAMVDPAAAPAGGRLSRIAIDGTRLPVPSPVGANPDEGDDEIRIPKRPAPIRDREPNVEGLQGIYYAARQIFVGDVISSTPGDSRTRYSLVDGEEHLPPDAAAFDADCVIAAMAFLAESQSDTPLYLPVSFSTLLRPSRRAAYAEILAILPHSERRRLSAAVYDVPRAPSFQALKQLHEALDEHFSAIDLRTRDPAFEIEQLNPEAVTSVTLVLPQAEPERRLIVLRRFISKIDAYKRRRVWPAVTNVRHPRELDLALEARLPFVTGPAICRLQPRPMGGRSWPVDQLPVLSPAETLHRASA
ncbi:hypothetical protein [Phenylobacterium sp.]|uniref:hypothetical protein n=1 Tax=Phenylobacterium sp. TaxID=1871053 RepID=UPI00272F37BD|nr:hypothetical protein [Phenylobacterium sp.]